MYLQQSNYENLLHRYVSKVCLLKDYFNFQIMSIFIKITERFIKHPS